MAVERFDYVVIGSGSAGGVVAARLSEDPHVNVLLLEAGPVDDDEMIKIPLGFSTLFKTKWDWNYQTTAQKHLAGRRADWPRMRALGGCSSMNAMIYIRGNWADYDEWQSAYGADGWGATDVLPYFIKAERNARLSDRYHGQDGPLHVEDRRHNHQLSSAFIQAAVVAGLPLTQDFNGVSQYGVGRYQVTCRKGRRWSVADAYIRPAAKRPNLTVLTDAFVTRIVMDGSRAVAVEYRHQGQTHTTPAQAEIVLSAGAIGSPQLLMLSGIGPGAHLREMGIDVAVDSPGVGQNLQDHPVSGILSYTRGTSDLVEALTPANLLRWKATGTGPLTSNVAETGAFYHSSESVALPDIQLHVAPTGFYDNGLHEPVRRALTTAVTLVNVQSKGHVKLRSADPTWHPEIDPAYFDDRQDLEAMVGGFRRAYEILEQDPIARFIESPWLPAAAHPTDEQIIDSIAQIAQTLYHPVGTCAMGTIEGSVVAPDLRVHGVEGLRVADASVMPRVPRGNTNAPTIMIGEKCADLIKESR
jgi:choline dehydrogenase